MRVATRPGHPFQPPYKWEREGKKRMWIRTDQPEERGNTIGENSLGGIRSLLRKCQGLSGATYFRAKSNSLDHERFKVFFFATGTVQIKGSVKLPSVRICSNLFHVPSNGLTVLLDQRLKTWTLKLHTVTRSPQSHGRRHSWCHWWQRIAGSKVLLVACAQRHKQFFTVLATCISVWSKHTMVLSAVDLDSVFVSSMASQHIGLLVCSNLRQGGGNGGPKYGHWGCTCIAQKMQGILKLASKDVVPFFT